MQDPFNDLWIRAALASGWPILELDAPDEAAVLAARARVEALLGELLQSDEIEPFDPDDPEEPWTLRIPLPDLAPEDWVRIREVVPGATLRPGGPPASLEAEDRGLRLVETLEGGGLTAELAVGLEVGEIEPDLAWREDPDDEVRELEVALARAVASAVPGVAFESDRGTDTVGQFVDRSTGRPGLSLHFPHSAFEGLEADALLERRRELLTVVARVMKGRGDLSPRVRWTPRHGLSLWVDLIAVPGPGLPGDAVVSEPLVVWQPGWEGRIAGTEVQVHGPVDLSILEEHGAAGAGRRWIRTPSWTCVPTWRLPPDQDPTPLVEALAEGTPLVRAVPIPLGVHDRWDVLQPSWRTSAERCFVRLWDGVGECDLRERIYERAPSGDDQKAIRSLVASLEALDGAAPLRPGVPVRTMQDSAGRAGLELVFDRQAAGERCLEATLSAVARVPGHHALASWAYVRSTLSVRLWEPGPVEGVPDYR